MILTPKRESGPGRGTRNWLIFALPLLLALAVFEGYRIVTFYRDVSESKQSLLSLKGDLNLDHLEDSREEVAARRERLEEAAARLARAESFVKTDPLLNMLRPIPFIGDQASGLKTLVIAASESTETGLAATDVAQAFADYDEGGEGTSIEKALAFLQSQQEAMTLVSSGLQRLEGAQSRVHDRDLIGPLAEARADLDEAVEKLAGLVDGYERANAFLPESPSTAAGWCRWTSNTSARCSTAGRRRPANTSSHRGH